MRKRCIKNNQNCNFIKTKWLALVLTSMGISMTSAQVQAYNFTQLSEVFTPLSSGVILGSATGNTSSDNLNSVVYPVTIPFSFNFNGEEYTNLYMSSNGFVTFGNTQPTTTNTTPISSNLLFDGVIAPFGRDLSSFHDISSISGDMRYDVVGTFPNRELILQWTNFRPVAGTSTSSVYGFSFQLKLKESTNEIKTTYSSGNYLAGSSTITQTAQIGLRGVSNKDFNNRINSVSQSFNDSDNGTANTSVQSFSTLATSAQGMPDDGLTYKWVPPTCFSPRDLVSSAPTANSVHLAWKSVMPAPTNGYDIYYSTTNVAPNSTTVPQISQNNSNTVTLNNLLPSKLYYVWVKSSCATGDSSDWSEAHSFSTSCVALDSIDENFDAYGTGNILPTCWVRLTSGTSGIQTINAVSPASGTRNVVQICGAAANPVIVVLPETSNIGLGTHRLRFKARVNSTTAGALHVGYVTDITDYNSFTIVSTENITNSSYTDPLAERIINFPSTIPSTARIAIKNTNDGLSYFWDDVTWEEIPNCIEPNTLAVSSITPSSATLSWQAPSVVPSDGYEIYHNTTGEEPTSTTTPTIVNVQGNSFTFNSLQSAITHYIWMRSKCNSNSTSAWTTVPILITTPCSVPEIQSVENALICGSGTATLRAVAPQGVSVKWYDAPMDGNVLGTGNEFVTPVLSSSQDYWVGTDNFTTGYIGMTAPISFAGNTTFNNAGIVFNAFSNMTIEEVDIYAYSTSSTTGGTGSITVAVLDANGTTIQSGDFAVNSGYLESGAIKNTIPLNFSISAGSGYQLVITSKSGTITGLIRENALANMTYPYVLSPIAGITTSTSMPYYNYFYNIKVSGGCASPRQLVRATVDSNCLGTSEFIVKENITVYPNPFVESIAITNYSDVKSVVITDLSGRIMRRLEKVQSQVNLSDLNSGMYLLILQLKDDSNKSIKIIKK